MRKNVSVLSVLTCLCLVLPMALAAQGGAAKSVSPFGFMMENAGIRVVVDAEATRYQGKSKYIPLVVFVGSSGAQTITLNRGAFTLTDPSGAVHPLATQAEISDKKNYGSFNVANDYTFVHKTINAGPDVQSYNGLGFQDDTCFFPNVSGRPSLVRDNVQVRPNAFTAALLYFANPAGKAAGIYKLTYTDPATKTVVVVPFVIKWK